MKKLELLRVLVVMLVCGMTIHSGFASDYFLNSAPNDYKGRQDNNPKNQIIQQCINLSDLHQYYLLQPNGIPEYLYIVDKQSNLPEDLKASRFGTELTTVTMTYILNNNIENYFILKSLIVNEHRAETEFNLFFQEKKLNVQFLLENRNSNWIITSKKITELNHE